MLPTDEEVSALKAKFKSLVLVEIEDEAFVIRPPARPEYEEYFNERHNAEGSVSLADANILAQIIVWPALEKATKILDDHPGYRARVAELAVEHCGGSIDLIAGSAAQPLSKLVKGEREQLEAAGYALKEKREERHFFVRCSIGPVVYRHPSRAASDTYRDKISRLGLQLSTSEQLCYDSVDHPTPEELKAMFDRHPALIAYHAGQLRNTSGANAEARGKKI